MTQALRSTGLVLIALVVGVSLGGAVVMDLQLGFIMWAGLLGAIALLVGPASIWALAALVGALTFKGLATLGILPDVAIYLDIPLAWGALLAAILRSRPEVPKDRTLLFFFGLLVFAVVVSYAANPSELLRPVLYLMLLGEPFALIAALSLDPPSRRMRTAILVTMAALVLLQFPTAVLQAVKFGFDTSAHSVDPIQGTLYGSGAGAHVFSAVVILGCMWWLSGKKGGPVARFLLAVPFLALPFMADAKQVIFAVPAVLLVGGWRAGAWQFMLRVAVVVLLINQVLGSPNSDVSIRYLEQHREGEGGKVVVTRLIVGELLQDPARFIAGFGPAESVSRAAFMTTYLFTSEDSAIAKLGLHPATMALHANSLARDVSGGGSSFNSAVSSMLGVLGDLGMLGALAYGGLLATVMVRLRRRRAPLAVASLGGWAMFIVLGFVYDWWEQPPFGVFLALMTAMALTDPAERDDAAPVPVPLVSWRPPVVARPLPGPALGQRR